MPELTCSGKIVESAAEASTLSSPTTLSETPVQKEAAHLPDGVVRAIAGFLVGESSSLLSLLSLCGVCRQWRNVAQELSPEVCLSFDSFDNTFSSQTAVQKFRKLTPVQKEEVLARAARHFTGKCYGDSMDKLLFSATLFCLDTNRLPPGRKCSMLTARSAGSLPEGVAMLYMLHWHVSDAVLMATNKPCRARMYLHLTLQGTNRRRALGRVCLTGYLASYPTRWAAASPNSAFSPPAL